MPCLYNSLPNYQIEIESVDTEFFFKFELEKFLQLIPDGPKMTNYVMAPRGNSILDQLSHRIAQGIYKGAEVSHLAAEQG